MEHESNEPISLIDPAEPASPAVARWMDDSFTETKRLRHDGWDGPKMAAFCQTLAETGVVTEACMAAGMSAKSAYALRHRDPLFASAWEAALSMARARLADELLARSLKGSAEQILRDGCIWGERHHFDNKLAFAILRRLDRRAEYGATFRTPARGAATVPAPAVRGQWQPLLDSLSEGRNGEAARLLALKSTEGNEGNNPPNDESDIVTFRHERLWQTWDTREWRTNFPPPPGFDGFEDKEWEDEDYDRELSDEEYDALVAAGIAEAEPEPPSLDEDEAARDAFFAQLRSRAVDPSAEQAASTALAPSGGTD